ncbi:phage tail tube protein [Pararhizobium sp.]|uniref:phage tail tube protein n=1 Tax=Pararhizobium sp. TaxID=1977563 RepID=UPI003D0B87A9
MSLGFRRWNKLAALFKREATYGQDSTPLPADALLFSNVTFTPMTGDRVSRDLILPYLGNQGVVLAGIYARFEGDIEIAGAGAAGTIPRYGALLRAAGFAEVVTAGTKVEYTLIDDNQDAGSLYIISDKVKHILVGCRVNIAPNWTAKGIPRWRVTIVGLLGAITDVAVMPTVTKAGWTKPLVVSKANTLVTIHAWDAVAESISVDLGNTLTPRFLIGDEVVAISNRSTTASAVVEARDLAEVNWFEKAISKEADEVTIQHGTVAGNIVEHIMAAVEISEPTQGQTDGIINYTIPMDVTPINGLDELKIVVR